VLQDILLVNFNTFCGYKLYIEARLLLAGCVFEMLKLRGSIPMLSKTKV
jgi:hypothetical protein